MSLLFDWARIKDKKTIREDLERKLKRNRPANEVLWVYERRDTTQSAVATALESSETMAPKKYRNLGAPPEGSGIAIVDIVKEKRALSDTLPECAEKNGFWRYNSPAIEQLIEKWVIMPWEDSFLSYLAAIPGDATAKAQVMNGKDEPFPGCLDADDGEVFGRGNFAYWWVVSSDGSVRYVVLDHTFSMPKRTRFNHPGDGFLVPVSSDEN